MIFDDIIKLPDRPKLMSAATLAYIGDSLYELFIRTTLIENKQKTPSQLHQAAIKYVNAAAQARLLEQLNDSLNKEEKSIVRRGRNADINVPASADAADYHYSTGFEALLGYLYLKGDELRLKEILTEIKTILFKQ